MDRAPIKHSLPMEIGPRSPRMMTPFAISVLPVTVTTFPPKICASRWTRLPELVTTTSSAMNPQLEPQSGERLSKRQEGGGMPALVHFTLRPNSARCDSTDGMPPAGKLNRCMPARVSWCIQCCCDSGPMTIIPAAGHYSNGQADGRESRKLPCNIRVQLYPSSGFRPYPVIIPSTKA